MGATGDGKPRQIGPKEGNRVYNGRPPGIATRNLAFFIWRLIMHDAGLRPMLSLIAVLCAPIFCAGRHNLASIGPLNKLPLRFEANEGQTTSEVKFVSHGPGYTLFLSGDQVVLSLTQPAVKT